MSQKQSWQPILHGDQANRAWEIAKRISERRKAEPDVFSLLLDAYLAQELRSGRHAHRALRRLRAALAKPQWLSFPRLYGGLAGIGFVLEHVGVCLDEWIDKSDEDPAAEVDTALLQMGRKYPPRGVYDLIGGLAGIAVYAVERLYRSGSDHGVARDLLAVIVDRLDQDAERTNVGITWRTGPEAMSTTRREKYPAGYYDLGVAHGVPALTVVLAEAVARDTNAKRAELLLEGAVSWITLQQQEAGPGARFPAWITGTAAPPAFEPGEAWCYGGLGVAVALLRAADALGGSSWREKALSFARMEATRPASTSGVSDACLCHGAAGNAHLYNRLYQATQDLVFLTAARNWFQWTLSRYDPADKSDGFLFRWAGDGAELTSRSDGSFLNGSAGVALALIAAAGRTAPAWDHLLLANASVSSAS